MSDQFRNPAVSPFADRSKQIFEVLPAGLLQEPYQGSVTASGDDHHRFDMVSFGELLVDFTPTSTGTYRPNAGGAPANVAVQASRLGLRSAFMGQVGNDSFGRFLSAELGRNDVDITCLRSHPTANTTLAFVSNEKDGDRSFTFYRQGTADTQMLLPEMNTRSLERSALLHMGSLLFTQEPSRSTALSILKKARQQKKLISYDPNWREPLWPSRPEGLAGMKLGLEYCDILKLSEEELFLLAGTDKSSEAYLKVSDFGASIVAVTRGARGAVLINREGAATVQSPSVKAVDTTGSGDAFMGTLLTCVLKSGRRPDEYSLKDLTEFGRLACAAGAAAATRRGAIPALPDWQGIVDVL